MKDKIDIVVFDYILPIALGIIATLATVLSVVLVYVGVSHVL